MKIKAEKDVLLLLESFDYVDAIRTIPGAVFNRIKKAWEIKVTPFSVNDIKAALPFLFSEKNFHSLPAIVTDALNEWGMVEAAQKNREAQGLPAIPITKLPAWNHQLQAYHFVTPLKAAMLSMYMGTGKSKVTIDIIVNRGHKRILILCPNAVMTDVWPGEFEKQSLIKYQIITMEGYKTIAEKIKALKQKIAGFEARNLPWIFICNYESAWRPDSAAFIKSAGFDLCVLDESHRAKSADGKAATFIGSLADIIPYRLCLTGTPLPNSPLDAFGQYRFLEPSIFGKNYIAFKKRYAELNYTFTPSGTPTGKFFNMPEFNQKFYSIAFRCGDDVLDLPEVQHIYRRCRLSAAGLKVYKQMERDLVAEIGDGILTASNALVKFMRLQQITSGTVQDDDGTEREVDTSKRELFEDIIQDIATREPVVVFAHFTRDLENIRAICESQGRRYAELSGRENKLKDWKAGEYDVIGIQLKAGGVGVDCTRAMYCFYYSVGFNLGDYEQSLARTHRPGQKRNVVYYHLVSGGTVDEKVNKSLADKKSVIDAVLDMYKKENKNA